tara:strand:+ start:583 stop:894 length:312 start_codon:yes stop_codon:yes gene_type:complete
MDFMKYSDRPLPLMDATIDSIVDAYNLTPPNFENPPDATIERVVAAVCKQMKEDKTYEESASPKKDNFFSEDIKGSLEKTSSNESSSTAATPKINDFKLESPD